MNIPFIENEEIWRQADAFRTSPELEGSNLPPLDVLYIVDVALRFDVIEIPNLFADIRMDAAIVPGEKAIYVDRDALEGWDRQERWSEKRLRFSIAHELGHYIMHRELLNEVRFSDFDAFKRWISDHRRSGRIEDQANEFAGRFLVPLDMLLAEYDAIQERMAAAEPRWREIEGIRAFVAKKIAPRFGINPQVIETRFDHERIWPLE